MKAIPFKISKDENSTIKVQVDDGPHFYDKLHYHPEIQLTTIVRGRGIVYGGNNMVNFKEGDVIVFGANIPHLLKNAPAYYLSDSPGVLSYSLFFDAETFGGAFFKMKELEAVYQILRQAQKGILVRSQTVADKLCKAVTKRDAELVIAVLDVLVELQRSEHSYINSELYQLSLEETVGHRLNEIISYTFAHMSDRISISDVAAVASLSKSQFSRYFKAHTGKSYVQFLNDLRIETACSLLAEADKNIEQVCYEVGFQNVSNFNRQFKKQKNRTPRQYRSDRRLAIL